MHKSRLKKIFEHFQKGTIIWRFSNHRQIENERKWIHFVASDREYLDLKTKHFIIRLYKKDLISKAIYFNEFESAEIKFLQNYLRKGDVFFDVGGNVGLFTLLAAQKVTKTGKVYSFEPSKKNFSKLNENIVLNNFIHVEAFNLGISDRNETKNLYNFKDGLGALSSYAPIDDGEHTTEVTVTSTLDKFIDDNSVSNVDVIKIDVEGWELPVLLGSGKLLKRTNAPLLIVEFTDANARSAGFSCQLVYDQLVGSGYTIYRIQNDSRIAIELKRDFYEYTNLIAVKSGSSAYLRIKHLICK